MSDPKQPVPPAAPKESKPGFAGYFAINSSTGALLGAIILVCMGSELWGPFLPKYMSNLGAAIFIIGVYGSFRDLLEAVNYLLGGWIAGRFNTRRGLLLFNALPLVGLTVLLLWRHWAAAIVAIPFVFVWDSLAGPALLTVVGDSLPSDRRAMAFSLQSLMRRLSRGIAYAVNAGIVVTVGQSYGLDWGMTTAFGISFVVVLASLAVQAKFMKTASKDSGTIIHQPLKVLRGFDPQLKRLLWADIFARWAEGTPRELIILFSLPVLAKLTAGNPILGWASYGGMLIISQVTSAITYLPMGALASRPGLGKRPYIGWTFFFFASFPAVLALAGWLAGSGAVSGLPAVALMCLAFVFMGMREIGEPARKAMIVDLIPPDVKTQCIGIYWAYRSAMVMAAPMVGAAVWAGANALAGKDIADASGPGPIAMLLAASLFGAVGVVYYYGRFGKPVDATSA